MLLERRRRPQYHKTELPENRGDIAPQRKRKVLGLDRRGRQDGITRLQFSDLGIAANDTAISLEDVHLVLVRLLAQASCFFDIVLRRKAWLVQQRRWVPNGPEHEDGRGTHRNGQRIPVLEHDVRLAFFKARKVPQPDDDPSLKGAF